MVSLKDNGDKVDVEVGATKVDVSSDLMNREEEEVSKLSAMNVDLEIGAEEDVPEPETLLLQSPIPKLDTKDKEETKENSPFAEVPLPNPFHSLRSNHLWPRLVEGVMGLGLSPLSLCGS